MAVESKGKDGGPDQPSGDRKDSENDQEFLDAVQGCLEDLMSKENLAEDPVIQQHLNAQMYVPLYILAAHQRILKLGTAASMETLLKAARQSNKLSVDADNMLIRPMMKQRRNTIILHDLPDDVQEAELHELFMASPESESLSSVKPDVNHTAFVTFNSDEAAQTVALWLRSQKFRGNSVKCAIKSDHYMRSFFPAQPPNQASTLSQLSSPGQGAQAMSWPNSPWTGPASHPWLSPGMGPQYDPTEGWAGGWAQGQPEKGSGKGGKGGKKGGKKGGRKDSAAEYDAEAAAQAEAHARMEQAMAGMGEPEDCGEIEVGYTHEFRRYTKQEIVQICSSLETVTKPESFAKFEKEHKDVALFRSSPYKDWAPPPTPMLFASGGSGLAGDMGHRRSSSVKSRDQGDDRGEGSQNRRRSRPPRKQSASSGSWGGARGSRTESGEYYEGGSGDWSGWDWPAGADGGWAGSAEQGSRARQRTSSARGRGSWGDWYGQTWMEKKDTEQPAEEKKDEEEKVAAKPTWVEKVKGIDKTQSWVEKVKGKTEAESSESGVAAKASSRAGAARPAGPPGSGSGAAAAQPTGAEKG